MRASRWAFVVKGAVADRPVVVTAFLVVLLAATLVAAIPIYAKGVAQSGLRERLARAPVTAANLQATVHVFEGGGDGRLDRRVRRIARDVFSVTGVSIFRSGESEPFAAAGKTIVFGFFDGLPRHARLRAGRWPASREAPLEVVVPGPVARRLGLEVGDVVRARSRLSASRVVAARVVGIYRAERPGSAYWWGQPLAADAIGPLVTTQRSFFALGLEDAELRWRLQPDSRRLTIDRVPGLRRELALLPRRLNAGRPEGEQFSLDTKLPTILAGAERSLERARAGVLVPSIQLALLALYGLILTAGLLIERRLARTESLRLRGATAGQLIALALMEASLIAVPAVAVAPWLAAASLHAPNAVGPLAGIRLRLDLDADSSAYALEIGRAAWRGSW